MMKTLKTTLLAAVASSLAVASSTAPAIAQGQSGATSPVPIEVWALRDVVNAVEISPDGKHVLVHKVESKEGEYVLEIYKIEDMSKPFRRLNADPMEIIFAQWVSDDTIFGTAWQQTRDKVRNPEEDSRDYKGFAYNLKANKFVDLPGNFGLVNKLPKEPNHILVASGTAVADATGVDPYAAFRPKSYYRFDLRTGARELVLKGSEKYPDAVFDNDGNPRWTSSVEPGTKELVYYYRGIGDTSWKKMDATYDLDEYKNLYRVLGGFMGIKGFDPKNPNIGYIIDNRGEDKAALWEFDFRTGQFGEKLAATNQADIMWAQFHSQPGNDTLVAARYPWAKRERVWFDAEEKALYEALEAEIPFAHAVSITSRSRDGKSMIVENSGPHDPGSYWLVNNGRIAKLGSANPLLEPEQLSDVEFIRYKARDGETISGYVTKPKGKGPFPLIVLPHGGPHVNEVIGYDEWGQFLANNGYMVLQPQYRMSVGWGQKLFDSAYGEHGGKMQDDKDDGAKYLVQQGIVDPDRIAMFGWSYGGYAALVASQRQDQMYQCVIAGAAVADPAKSYRERRNPYSPKALDEWSKRRGMIGINPVKDVIKTNIPVMMVHGDVDRRVELYHLEDFKQALTDAGLYNPRVTLIDDDGKVVAVGESGLKKAGSDTSTTVSPGRHRFVVLKGADHFYATLMYKHQKQLYTEMLDFLKNDCGPGGL